jgi:ABC-type cobalamin transport system permease subunit
VSIETPPEGEIPPRADLVSALVWMAFGGAVAVGSWRMDRLENLHINKYEVPGLVPGLLGTAVFLLGSALALRAIKRGALLPTGPRQASEGIGRMGLVFAAMLLYSLVLVGHGLPFWLATGAFVAAFIFFFDRERQTALGRSTPRQALLALACGVIASAVVTFTFQEVFYVRLP